MNADPDPQLVAKQPKEPAYSKYCREGKVFDQRQPMMRTKTWFKILAAGVETPARAMGGGERLVAAHRTVLVVLPFESLQKNKTVQVSSNLI